MRLSSYCTKRANNGVNLVTSRNINKRLARLITPFTQSKMIWIVIRITISMYPFTRDIHCTIQQSALLFIVQSLLHRNPPNIWINIMQIALFFNLNGYFDTFGSVSIALSYASNHFWFIMWHGIKLEAFIIKTEVATYFMVKLIKFLSNKWQSTSLWNKDKLHKFWHEIVWC